MKIDIDGMEWTRRVLEECIGRLLEECPEESKKQKGLGRDGKISEGSQKDSVP